MARIAKILEKTLKELSDVDRIETLSIRTSLVSSALLVTWSTKDEDEEKIVGFCRETGT